MKLIYQSPKNPNSHLTIKERKFPSYPTKHLFSAGLVQGRVLDFGCGSGIDVEFLRKNGFEVIGYDPHYAPEAPSGQFDTILCNYVLNVLLPEEQTHVLMAVSELLKPTGCAYFTVRRDIQHNGFRMHVKHGINVYQCNVILPYRTILKTENCEIYGYRHINQFGNMAKTNCPFCSPNSEQEIITESATAFAMLDKYPVSKGHTLIIPKHHVENYFDLSEHSKTACWLVVDRAKRLLTERFNPDGFNIGVNIGYAGGQTIPHLHIHLIPRYDGDVTNPSGGVRNVIPSLGDYVHPKQG